MGNAGWAWITQRGDRGGGGLQRAGCKGVEEELEGWKRIKYERKRIRISQIFIFCFLLVFTLRMETDRIPMKIDSDISDIHFPIYLPFPVAAARIGAGAAARGASGGWKRRSSGGSSSGEEVQRTTKIGERVLFPCSAGGFYCYGRFLSS